MRYIYSNDFGTGDRAKISFSREKRNTHTQTHTKIKKKIGEIIIMTQYAKKIILPAASSFSTSHNVISVLITVFLDKLRSGG